ncbi:MAG: hypothetical protein JKX80_02785, partial [Candidatus Pacebacteria bacterium]|nr:hypothetical protein [Candidatus Paceibacterota bacterium]
ALSWLRGSSKSSLALVFDIGSATVGVAIAKYKKGKPINVFFTHRVLINYGTDQSAKSLGGYVGTAIEKAATEALEQLGRLDVGSDYTVHAIVHAPWTDSQAQRAEGVLEEETLITRELLQQFTVRHLPEQKVEGRIQFDRHITRIELNGYSTTQPYKKKAKKIAVTILKSSMSDSVHASILNAFSSALPNHDVHIDAFLFAATQLRELFAGNDAYTIIDVGEEYTSLSIVRDETVAGSAWASFGTEYLIRAISKEDAEARQSAISQLTMYIDNTCTPAQCRDTETALEKPEKEWTRTFGDACTKLSKIHRMPTKTFVSVDKHYGPWFKRVIEKIDFGQFTVTGRPLEAQLLSIEKAARSFSFAESVKRDSMLSLGILFVDK